MNNDPQHSGSHQPRHRHSGETRPERQGEDRPTDLLNLRGSKSLERLRDRIQVAAAEIMRLREENAALAARLAQLQSSPAVVLDEGTSILFDESPESLQRRVASLIEAIDQYLEGDHKQDVQ
jgi:hypothetical protein